MPTYFVYGVCVQQNERSGDSLAMLSDRFETQVNDLAMLEGRMIRYKQRYFVKHAKMRRNADFLRILGRLRRDQLPEMDHRYRMSLQGLSKCGAWHIISDSARIVVPRLTREMAVLSDDGIAGLEFIQNRYDKDLFPWSAHLTSQGATDFDPLELEAEMQLNEPSLYIFR
jgi:hypothetical protein